MIYILYVCVSYLLIFLHIYLHFCIHNWLNRPLSQQTLWLHKAGKAQVEFLTLMMAAFCSGELWSTASLNTIEPSLFFVGDLCFSCFNKYQNICRENVLSVSIIFMWQLSFCLFIKYTNMYIVGAPKYTVCVIYPFTPACLEPCW